MNAAGEAINHALGRFAALLCRRRLWPGGEEALILGLGRIVGLGHKAQVAQQHGTAQSHERQPPGARFTGAGREAKLIPPLRSADS